MLTSYLNDSAELVRRIPDRTSFRDCQRHRFLQIDVLARGHRIDCHLRVPVVRRADEHRIDVIAREQFAIVQKYARILQFRRVFRTF
jgi:hypothetical protein